jgi:hypothetical protein
MTFGEDRVGRHFFTSSLEVAPVRARTSGFSQQELATKWSAAHLVSVILSVCRGDSGQIDTIDVPDQRLSRADAGGR